jgi:hemolysin III
MFLAETSLVQQDDFLRMTVSSPKDELANALTHGLGAMLAVAALVLLVVFSAIYGSALHVVSFTVFGSTLVILYLASTLYHSFSGERVKALFQKLDHMSIFLLIAGTYTPFCLVALPNWIGWTLFGIIWGSAAIGIVLKAWFTGKKEALSTAMYIVMGWVALIAIKPLYDALPGVSFALLLAGGVSYTAGTYFFARDRKPYFHSIWHLFVLGGSVLHFFAVLFLL